MSEWRRLEKGEAVRVQLQFENGVERTTGGDFGGFLTVDDGPVCLELWMEGGSSDLFDLRDIVEIRRA